MAQDATKAEVSRGIEGAGVVRRVDYRPPAFLIDHVDLRVDLALPTTIVTAHLTFRRNTAKPADPLVLDGIGLKLTSILLNDVALGSSHYSIDGKGLTVFDPPTEGVLTTTVEITPSDTGMEGLIFLNGAFVTHCEPAGFRRITFFPDRPDILARYRCTLVADEAAFPILLSNGRRVICGQMPGGRHFATWEDPYPKATYLFALLAGNFARITERVPQGEMREVELSVYAAPEDIDACRHGLATLKEAMLWDEKVYGRRYDLDVLNVGVLRSYPGGAMENKGLNLYASEFFLAAPSFALDDEILKVEATVAHEYFHNWTGNRVGCRDWFELSLKEGFTIFRQQQFMEDRLGFAVARIDEIARLRQEQYPEDDGKLAHAVRPATYGAVNNLYTRTVYEMGAELIRMMRTILGPAAFMTGVREFFATYDGVATTIDAFIEVLEAMSGVDLAQFRRWYDLVGGLKIEAIGSYDVAARRYRLVLRQVPLKAVVEPMHVPLRLSLLNHSGRALPLRLSGESENGDNERLFHLRAPVEVLMFEDIPAAPVPSLFRELSAPVRLSMDMAADDLRVRACSDSDPVSRWDAVQELLTRALLATGPEREILAAAWFEVFGTVITDTALDPAVAARMLCMPPARQLGQRQSEIQVEVLHNARVRLAAESARAYYDVLRATYHALMPDAADAMGSRRLRNICLWYLAHVPEESAPLCLDHFHGSDLMENRITALQCLIAQDAAESGPLLTEAYTAWKDHPAMLDQWFAVQARAETPTAARLVRALATHPACTLDNATRMKAFYGAFGHNQIAFHDRSGAGYTAVFDIVARLNHPNPRLAARFLKTFSDWTRYDSHRRGLIGNGLSRLAEMPGLAPDLADILTQTLDRV